MELKKFQEEYQKWESIIKMDVENLDSVLTESQIVSVFEFLKQEKENLYRIPDKASLGCINIDLVHFKRLLGNALDDQI